MTKLDDLTAWRYLIAFSKTGTFLAAANLLEVDVSNISRGIASLERSLGCDLITGATPDRWSSPKQGRWWSDA